MSFSLEGRTALVTGAGQGVGEGIARVFADHGARVLVNDLVPERAARVAVETGGTAVPFDVRSLEAVQAALATRAPVDVLVHNAGIPAEGFPLRRFADMAPDEWAKFVDVNLYGLFNTVHAVLPGMLERGWGRIVFVSSEAGRQGIGSGISIYSAAKGGGVAFCRALSQEVARQGVTVNSLSLGRIEPPAGSEITVGHTSPVGRLGLPADVAAAALFLASGEAAWITGQTLPVNGGVFTS